MTRQDYYRLPHGTRLVYSGPDVIRGSRVLTAGTVVSSIALSLDAETGTWLEVNVTLWETEKVRSVILFDPKHLEPLA